MMHPRLAAVFLLVTGGLVWGAACGSTEPTSRFDAGSGDEAGSDAAGDTAPVPDARFPEPDGNAARDSGDGGCGPSLLGVLRDFKGANEPGGHPDFEAFGGDDRNMISMDLGTDGKPIYAGSPRTPTSTGKANFDQWYRDTPGVNRRKLYTLPAQIDAASGRTVFDSSAFFPLDNDPEGFGNTPGQAHDFHFTYELHTEFAYTGGEIFKFRGDDDVWVFINNKRVVDLGGVHGAQEATVNLDQEAARLGIAKGSSYPFDFFFAERHTVESNFRMETTLKFVNCAPIIR